jgi:hypothetical protein
MSLVLMISVRSITELAYAPSVIFRTYTNSAMLLQPILFKQSCVGLLESTPLVSTKPHSVSVLLNDCQITPPPLCQVPTCNHIAPQRTTPEDVLALIPEVVSRSGPQLKRCWSSGLGSTMLRQDYPTWEFTQVQVFIWDQVTNGVQIRKEYYGCHRLAYL